MTQLNEDEARRKVMEVYPDAISVLHFASAPEWAKYAIEATTDLGYRIIAESESEAEAWIAAAVEVGVEGTADYKALYEFTTDLYNDAQSKLTRAENEYQFAEKTIADLRLQIEGLILRKREVQSKLTLLEKVLREMPIPLYGELSGGYFRECQGCRQVAYREDAMGHTPTCPVAALESAKNLLEGGE